MALPLDPYKLRVFTRAAYACIEYSGLSMATIRADIQLAYDEPDNARALITARCLDGADDETHQGWYDYVDAVCGYAAGLPKETHVPEAT